MRLLAWDTSSKVGSLAALQWDAGPARTGPPGPRLISEWTLNVETTHSERLLWAIDQMLEAARWKLEDIDLFGVGVGPGSFTGLRIGITTARTLAHTLGKPLIGISSLAALARPVAVWAASSLPKRRCVVVATTDAAKGELFALWGSAKSVVDCVAMAEGDLPGLWKRGVEERVLPPPELMKAVKRKLIEGEGSAFWLAVGEGRHRYPDAWRKLPAKQEIAPPAPFSDHVQGRYVGLLAWEAFQAGQRRDALDVHPRYIRAADAEVRLKAGLLKPSPSVSPEGES